MAITRQERGTPPSSSFSSLRLGSEAHVPSSSSPPSSSCSSTSMSASLSSFSFHRRPRPSSPSFSRCSTDSRSNSGEEEEQQVSEGEEEIEVEEGHTTHDRTRDQCHHRRSSFQPLKDDAGAVNPEMKRSKGKQGQAWAASMTTIPVTTSSSSSSSSPSSSSSSSPSLLVSVTHCQGGYRPFVECLQAKYGWLMTSHLNESRAQLWFTDIKRAGKGECFRTIEAARQRRLHHHNPSTSTSSALSSSPHVNCFPGMAECVTKSHLGRSLSFFQSLFPSDFDFFPSTFDLTIPSQLSMAREQLSHGRVLIVKPSRGSQGNGIVLVQHFDQVQSLLHLHPRRPFIAQRYINDPLLLDGHKFDLRVYVVIESLHPLKVHVFKDGLARVCTEPYQQPTARNLHQPFIHLTNYSLNKNNGAHFKQATEDDQHHSSSSSPVARLGDDSNKRSIKTALSQLSYQGSPVDVERFWSDVSQVVECTIAAMFPTLFGQYVSHFPSSSACPSLPSACFQLLGFDLLLDSRMKVWLLEVNSAPSMSTDSALDYRIKMSVMDRMMHILGYATDTHHSTPLPPSPPLRPSSRQVNGEEEGPLTSRSTASYSSSSSRRSSLSSTGSLSSSSSSLRPLSSSSLRRALASSCSAPTTRGSILTDRSLTPTLPRSYALPVVDSRELHYISMQTATSSYSHVLLFSHPTLLTLYCHFTAGSSAGLSSSAFRRLLTLFFNPPLSSSSSLSSSRSPPPCSADLDLLYLNHTKRGVAQTSLMTFDGFCHCLAHVALSCPRPPPLHSPSLNGAWTGAEGRRWMEVTERRWREGGGKGDSGGVRLNERQIKTPHRLYHQSSSSASAAHRKSSVGSRRQ